MLRIIVRLVLAATVFASAHVALLASPAAALPCVVIENDDPYFYARVCPLAP